MVPQGRRGDYARPSAIWRCYLSSIGVEQDTAEAVKWLNKAAEQDYARAVSILGDCYRDGNGVE